MRNLSMSAAVVLRMQSYLLRVVASVCSMCFAGEPRGSAPRCYTIDAQKFDETKHYLAPVGNATGRKRFMRKRRHDPAAFWHVLVHRRVLRWRIGAFAEYELSLVTPPQFMGSTSAATLWPSPPSGTRA